MQSSGMSFSNLMPKGVSNKCTSKWPLQVLVVISSITILNMKVAQSMPITKGLIWRPSIQEASIKITWRIILQDLMVILGSFNVRGAMITRMLTNDTNLLTRKKLDSDPSWVGHNAWEERLMKELLNLKKCVWKSRIRRFRKRFHYYFNFNSNRSLFLRFGFVLDNS
uniref:Uncharacterized protein n=1 Tax=Cucumis melo TaxID=3656 RepID=A0A9I9E9U3_CUCME